ncbi:hypothetical protein [Fusobacterium ulcerans]|uniref:Uncharacterized protein n=1 Tax=Fusobacterium ulcerans 12-1B TaxID=457404 RepID=H1PVN0_9FUSO|nr:hypothetical protein [Fusobacterium ulcerans]EHO79734.1 hypothetical protein HMPREF0402_02473 [Fusobacterium ulcerans 12-1B]
MTNNEKIINLAKDLKLSTGYSYRVENKIHILEIADLEFTGDTETEVFNEAIKYMAGELQDLINKEYKVIDYIEKKTA